jgi:hypothetical protein
MIDVVHVAFNNSVTTRSIEKLAKAPGMENISPSQVSEINNGFTDPVDASPRCARAGYPKDSDIGRSAPEANPRNRPRERDAFPDVLNMPQIQASARSRPMP